MKYQISTWLLNFAFSSLELIYELGQHPCRILILGDKRGLVFFLALAFFGTLSGAGCASCTVPSRCDRGRAADGHATSSADGEGLVLEDISYAMAEDKKRHDLADGRRGSGRHWSARR